MTQREFIASVPTKLAGIIIGIVLYVNSDHIASASPAGQNVLGDNIVLLSSLIVALSSIKLLVDWYLAATEEDNKI
jgi:hypothetical protein